MTRLAWMTLALALAALAFAGVTGLAGAAAPAHGAGAPVALPAAQATRWSPGRRW
jgi:hypothetical protein